MLARHLLTAWLCLLAWFATAPSLCAQETNHEGAGSAAQAGHPSAQEHAAGAEHAEHSTMAMSNGDILNAQFSHSVPYVIWPHVVHGEQQPPLYALYNVNPWQWVSIVLLTLLFLPVAMSFGRGRSSWPVRVLRGFCLWVRDDLVYAVMGKEHGRPFVPFVFFLFFFLVAQNSIGLIPSFGHGSVLSFYTATGTPYVTGAFAVITLLLMLVLGMKKNGVVGFWKGLVPHGLPVLLIPVMFVIEIVSLMVKPFALTIRLFANMLAGHLVIASAIGLVFVFAKMMGGSAMSYLTMVPCLGMAVFIYIIEAFVTLLQAYIFTLLTVTFVHQAMHQEH